MSKFKEALDSGKFVVTVELKPPKGVNTAPFLKTVDALAKKVDALNVPDNRSASMALGPLPASLLVKERGGEPICTFTCRDRNRMAISSDVLGAYALGIENILLVSGDYFTFGDTFQAKRLFWRRIRFFRHLNSLYRIFTDWELQQNWLKISRNMTETTGCGVW